MDNKKPIRLALLDMYDGQKNLGIGNIISLIEEHQEISYKRFDVRSMCELPGLDYDIYICSGGPGSPLEGDRIWDRAYYNLMDRLWIHNQRSEEKKYVYFICHSFQMICHHLSLGSVVLRKSESFGVFPVHKTEAGKTDRLVSPLPDPFYVADFRNWQFIQPDLERIHAMGCKILALEKIRPHVRLERAVMAMRFSDEWVGTQFHAEADPAGMILHFTKNEKKKKIIEEKGLEKYNQIISDVKDPAKLPLTHEHILPQWLSESSKKILSYKMLATL